MSISVDSRKPNKFEPVTITFDDRSDWKAFKRLIENAIDDGLDVDDLQAAIEYYEQNQD